MGERIRHQDIPYIPFPDNPQKIKVHGYTVYKYISAAAMNSYIGDLSEKVNLREFDNVIVNLFGGLELFWDLATLQDYPNPPSMVRYIRTDSGVGEVIPVHPSLKNKKVLLIEDILDRGLTIQEILKHLGEGSRCVVAVTKKGIKDQILDERVDSAAFIDNVWVAGKGMDAGFKDEGSTFRHYRGLVAVPQK